MEFWVAGISKAGRSSGDHLAHRTRVETRPAESVNIALLERHRKEGIPAETIGNGQLGCRFPGVLGVSPEEVLRQVYRTRTLLPELLEVSGGPVAQARPGRGRGDCEVGGGKGGRQTVVPRGRCVG